MKTKKFRSFACDFETTVYPTTDGQIQERTDVWASTMIELGTEDAHTFHSIDETFDYMLSLDSHLYCYYHNLKFDGAFWLHFLINDVKFKEARSKSPIDDSTHFTYLKDNDMPNGTFKYSISSKGQWYTITIKAGGHIIQLRDSLKLLPFSVAEIGRSFETKHKKLSMVYEGLRYPGCEITDEERAYIENDVFVIKEALEYMHSEGHDKLTIGSCCLSEYKKAFEPKEYADLFPNLYEVQIDPKRHGESNAGEWIKHSYRGGWCYVVPEKSNRVLGNGITCDVNSLYPSVMHSSSGNKYPYGLPKFWTGCKIPNEARDENHFFFIRIKTRFRLKPDKLPFIQVKGSWFYRGTENLTTSDIYNKRTGEYCRYWTDKEGNQHDSFVELTLTETDFMRVLDHYCLLNCEILDGCYFKADKGLFDFYINKYAEIKKTSKGAKRTLAKLFLNNLYGKMAANTDSTFKVAEMKEDGTLGFWEVEEHDKTPGFIACGSAITSYARDFTIRSAQKNFHGGDKPGFCYADTDSIHCDFGEEDLKDIPIDPVEFNNWKVESHWDSAIFARQKTYIEHIVPDNYNNIKCAGMPKNCKDLLNSSMTGIGLKPIDKCTDEEREFLYCDDGTPIKRTYADFKIGLKVPGKLVPKQINGGVLLVPTTYEMR